VAGVLTQGPAGGVQDTVRALVGLRRSLAGHAAGGSGTVRGLRVLGLFLGLGTLALGLVRFEDPDRSVDLLAALALGWLAGWVAGPIVVRGVGQGLRPEWFALLPIPPRRLAAGLLGAALVGWAPVATLIALASLAVTAARWGPAPLLVALPAVLLLVALMVLASRVVMAALAATMSSRRGQELGGLLMAVVIALASGGWSLATVVGQQLATGPPPALSTALRVLPSGWGAVAVAAADRGDWALALGALAGLAVACGLLLAAWARLLPATMRRPGGGAPRAGRRRAAAAWPGWLPASRTGAVAAKELQLWRRDPNRTLLVLLALLISGLQLAVPALAFRAPALLPWVGLVALLIVSMGGANLYGDEGTAFWLTRMVPGTEPADVRGRQLAWLLVVGPAAVALTVLLTALGGQAGAWPWVLAALPALLGGAAGLMVWVSASHPVPQKDPSRRSGPFDTGDDPGAAGAAVGQQYLMLVLVALTVVPGWALVAAGAATDQPALQAAGVLAGVATGALLWWWGGRVAGRRLADRGAELMDLLRLGPQAPAGPAEAAAEPAAELPAWKSAARGTLWTAAVVLIVPQGLVPIGFNLFGVDQQVKVWFAARYLDQPLQVPAALGCIALGLVAAWQARRLDRPA
jgi:ABC-2 type transport system permease protein